MNGYRLIRSLIGEVANGIDILMETGVISVQRKIALYGLGRYSFAMRTILEHRGIEVDCYVCEDEAEVIPKRREVKDFACRYLKSDRDVIELFTLSEYIDNCKKDESILLIADAGYERIGETLCSLGLREDTDFYKVCDFSDREISKMTSGMHRIKTDEMKDIEKRILVYVDQLCGKLGLRYWVCGGTLLGTIRHKGFIPWDDDIDIFLPFPDYLKLVSSFPENGEYEMIGYGVKGKENPIEMFAKVIDKNTLVDEDTGVLRKISYVWIDVFPLIGLPENETERRLFFQNYRETEKSAWQEFYAADGSMDVFEPWFEDQKSYLRRYDFEDAGYVGVVGTKYWGRDFTSKQVYNETLRMPFEDIEVNAPSGFDEYLRNLYGNDYMSIPPEDQRISVHSIRAYRMSSRDKG